MNMTKSEVMISCAFILVFLAVIVYATFFSKKGKLQSDSMEEFAVGSRSLGYFVVLCTLIGIFLPASSYTGWFAMVMEEGLIGQYIVVYSIAAFFMMYIFTQRIWIWGKEFHLLTQPDFVQLRFRSKPLTLVSAVCGVLIEAPWCVMEFASLGWLIAAVTGGAVSKEIGILIIGSLVLAYVIYGGMKSVAVTEVIKGILVVVVVVIGAVIICVKMFGGVGAMYTNLLAAVPEKMTVVHGGDYSYWNSIILTGTLGCFGWVSMFCRIYTAKNVKEVKKSASGGAVLVVFVSVMLYIVACGAALIPGALDAGEMAFFYMCKEAAGPFFLGLAGILVLSAAMGFIAVIMSSHGVVISENIIRAVHPNMTENGRRKSSRWSILIYGIICMVIAMQDLPNLAHIAIIVYEGVVQIIPLILFGIFWPRANKWSVGIGYVVGLAIALFLGIHPMPEVFGSWSGGCIGLIANIIINVILAFVIKTDQYTKDLFDVVKTYKEDADGQQIVTDESVEALKVVEKYGING